MESQNSPTLYFLRLIGSPYLSNTPVVEDYDFKNLYNYAAKNRIRLFYLNSLAKRKKCDVLQNERNELLEEYNRIQGAFAKVSTVLEKADINYVFFKSIRPYQEVTSDIDTLIFGSQYGKVLKLLDNAGFLRLGEGPLSTTFRDPDTKISIDIYEDVGVSHIIYIDKEELSELAIETNASGLRTVRSLSPEADLLAVIAHSVIKEHMYVLSEYYTTLYYLKNFENEMLSSLVSLTERCRLQSAVKTHLGITAFLHYYAHGFVPECIDKLLDIFDFKNNLEPSRIAKNGLNMPHRYHLATLTWAFVEKFGETKARRSLSSQISSMFNPGFASSFLRMGVNHFLRESY